MCFVYKRKRTSKKTGKVKSDKYYSGKYKLSRDSPYVTIALKTKDKQTAEKRLNDHVINLQRQSVGLLPENLEGSTVALIDDLLTSYIDDMNGRSVKTMHVYTTEKRLRRLCSQCNWKHVSDITSASFIQWRSKQKLAASTKNQYLEYLSTFCNWLVKHTSYPKENPMNKVDKLNEKGRQVRKRRAYTRDELQRILNVAGVYRAAYLMAFYTGLRRGELMKLEWRHVNFDTPQPYLRLEGQHTKNGEEAKLPLRSDMVDELVKMKPENASAHEAIFTVENLPSYYMLDKHRKLAGIQHRNEFGEVVDFHALRHTLATDLAANNVSPYVAKEIMRHSDIRVTMETYTHINNEAIQKGFAALPSFDLTSGDQRENAKREDQTKRSLTTSEDAETFLEEWTHGGTQTSDLSSHDLSLVDQTELIEVGSQVPKNKPLSPDLTQVDHSGQSTELAALLGLELILVI